MNHRETLRLLGLYFAARHDWPVVSPMGKDPMAAHHQGGDGSRLLRLCADVGAALEALTQEEQSAISYRWSLWISREEEDGEAARLRCDAMRALRSGNGRKFDQLSKTAKQHQNAAGRYSAELKRQQRRVDYIRAMDRLTTELTVRDIFARASTRDRCKIGA